METKYTGRIVTVPGKADYAFIGINSVAKNDGSEHGLGTSADIFLHKDDCATELKVGMTVTFSVTPDINRGTGFFRAQGAQEIVEAEIIPSSEAPMPGFEVLAPFGSMQPGLGDGFDPLNIVPTKAQQKMKPVDREVVKTVLRNKPAATIPRDSSEPANRDELMRAFLEHLFPTMQSFGTKFSLDGDEATLLANVEQARADQEALGMTDQIPIMMREVTLFLSLREGLSFMMREHLIRRDTIIPIKYLPDFFMAVPVWYLWLNPDEAKDAKDLRASKDPLVHPSTKYFCKLFPNQNWADIFQMFNRRVRTLDQYKGDIVPPYVLRRIREATKLFDYVTIMTPYHDVAGSDWENLEWLRSIDPYVVGFKKDIHYFFILARFSDSGTFPLFTELVADTIEFLKNNSPKLAGFNKVNNPYWHRCDEDYHELTLGTHLMKVTNQMLEQFTTGQLFNWLRGEIQPEKT